VDRSWREKTENPYANKELSRKDRFYSGGYSLPAYLGFKVFQY